MIRRVLMVVVALAGALGGFAQSDSAFRFAPEPVKVVGQGSALKPQLSIIAPDIITPKMSNYTPPEPLRLSNKLSLLPDSLKTVPDLSINPQVMPTQTTFDFRGNPFSRDWSAGGEIVRLTPQVSVVGSGSRTSLPALGNIGTATLGFRIMPTDRLTVAMGASGVKYHMGRSAWNDYGLYLNGSYRLSERLSVNAFGQYYFDQRYHSVAGMGYMQSAVYGGSLNYEFSDDFSLAVGAQRYFDPYTRTWKTVPILAPTFKLFGAPVSVDVGGLLHNIVEAIIYNARDNSRNYSVPAGGNTGPVHINPGGPFRTRRAQGGTIRP
ncbi:MAG: hypothetical protein Q4B68_01510 [Bacteroidales bacterium]|nr:hypothetical protein [Bacteroidales bacterium]